MYAIAALGLILLPILGYQSQFLVDDLFAVMLFAIPALPFLLSGGKLIPINPNIYPPSKAELNSSKTSVRLLLGTTAVSIVTLVLIGYLIFVNFSFIKGVMFFGNFITSLVYLFTSTVVMGRLEKKPSVALVLRAGALGTRAENLLDCSLVTYEGNLVRVITRSGEELLINEGEIRCRVSRDVSQNVVNTSVAF